jgi:protein-tyrosine phosphatase
MGSPVMPLSVLFVCMGNICRSPTVEGVFRHRVSAGGLELQVRIDSAGTHDYHAGRAPDSRAQAAALRRGYDLAGSRARQVSEMDFTEFDYVLAMDLANLYLLRQMAPPEFRDKPQLFLDYGVAYAGREVPDPFHGGARGFELVLDMAEDGASGLLNHIIQRLGT